MAFKGYSLTLNSGIRFILISEYLGRCSVVVKRQIEIFVAGCPLCDETVKLVKQLACDTCEVLIYNLREGCATNECREKAAQYGIYRVPSVVVDGTLVECCGNQKPVSREALMAAGVGQR